MSFTQQPSLGQDNPTLDAPAETAEVDENAPIVPATRFPSLISLDKGNQVWTLKVAEGRLKVKGDVVVNSVNRGAIWLANSSVEVQDGTIGTPGGVSRLGRISIQPTPSLGARVVDDPISEFTVPSPERVVSQEKLFLQTERGGEDTVLPPGIYNGGIFATGSGHITLQSGVFVIANGDFSAIGPTVEGEGVTIVMAGGNVGTLSFSLGARLNASAPTDGQFKNLLIVSRAAGVMARGVSFSVAQGHLDGLIYAPSSAVSFLSNSSVTVGKIIAKSVDVTSSSLSVAGFTDVTAQTAEKNTTPEHEAGTP